MGIFINSPESLDEAVHSHQHVISVFLRPALRNGEDGSIDILRVSHDVAAQGFRARSAHLRLLVAVGSTVVGLVMVRLGAVLR